MSHLANTARDIISDMFRWGIIREGSKYFSLDLRDMSDQDAIETMCAMDADGLISSDIHADTMRVYYVSDELISMFVTENWRLNNVPA